MYKKRCTVCYFHRATRRCSRLFVESVGKWYKGGKWAQLDLNRRPADYESAALTNWAIGPMSCHNNWFYDFSQVIENRLLLWSAHFLAHWLSYLVTNGRGRYHQSFRLKIPFRNKWYWVLALGMIWCVWRSVLNFLEKLLVLSIGSVGASTGKNELCERFEFVDVNSYCVFRYAQ